MQEGKYIKAIRYFMYFIYPNYLLNVGITENENLTDEEINDEIEEHAFIRLILIIQKLLFK